VVAGGLLCAAARSLTLATAYPAGARDVVTVARRMSAPAGQYRPDCRASQKEELMLRRSLLAAAMVLVPAGLAAAPAGIAAAAPASVAAPSGPASHPSPRCSGVIQITHLAFTPPAVTPGQIATANVVARNCTGTSQQASVF
jgi:hypothetical protein